MQARFKTATKDRTPTMKPPNPAVAIASIMKSNDKDWMGGFRAQMIIADAPEIVAAIDKRLGQIR
jgi:hypothetical protein